MENWKPIPGYEGYYEISDMGRVKSFHKKKTLILKEQFDTYGYHKTTLYFPGQKPGKQINIHRLVAEVFIPKPESDEILEVLHGPRGHKCSEASNLRWGTRSENMMEKHRDGTMYQLHITECPYGHSLEGLNLKPSDLKRGKRRCLACARASSYIYKYGGDMQTISDEYYEKINFANS